MEACSPHESMRRVRMTAPATVCTERTRTARHSSLQLLALPSILPRLLETTNTRAGTFFGNCFSTNTGCGSMLICNTGVQSNSNLDGHQCGWLAVPCQAASYAKLPLQCKFCYHAGRRCHPDFDNELLKQ